MNPNPKDTSESSKNAAPTPKMPEAELTTAALERERLISLINNMADGVLATDEQDKIVIYNGAALNILDLNENLLGTNIGKIGKIIDKNNQPVDFSKFVTSSTTQQTNRDLRLVYPDKSIINLYVSVAPVKLGFGVKGTKGFVTLLRDITREKSLEEERDEFISVVSHELRTPIAIAEGNVGNVEYLMEKSGAGNSEMKLALKQAHDQILFLSNMINDLATLSRAERGKLNVEVESINTHDLIVDLAATYKSQAEEKKLEIKTSLDPHLTLLKTSKLYLREILQNFITNAIKYTEKGSITVSAAPYEKGVVFEVSDTGIGISQSDQEKIFDKFFRSEDYRTRANSGTGLGLYVTMKLTRLIHADINMESEINKGSTFVIKVPNLE